MSIPPRTNPSLLIGLLRKGSEGGDYDDVTNPDLTPYIASASAVIDQVVAQSAQPYINRPITGTDAGSMAELLERWLACHFYAMSDQTYSSRSTAGASGQFRGQSGGSGFETTNYGRTAMSMDYSGVLKSMNADQRVRFFYGGTPPDEQTLNESNY